MPFTLYNPALLKPEDLLTEFVARRPLLETLLTTVRENKAGQAPQHALLVGQRGMGKTTMLWAIAHSINRDPELTKEWQPVVFDEESRRVGDLADFWLEAIRQWEHATGDTGNRAKPLLDQPGPDIEDRAREAFLDAVIKSDRRALLLIDNLNDVLASINKPEPLHRLRAFLMEESRIMLIGGATRYFPQITAVDQPFYDFFRIFELRPLTLEEMKACLLSLAKTRQNEAVIKTVNERDGTIQSLHLLTGGNPRLIKTFYRLLAEGLHSDIRSDLEQLLDEFTPYFKAIVDALPVQQQRIFDAVALNWDPVDVATIARATRLPSNQVSSQLRMLVKGGLVSEAAGHPKRKSYLLSDRFSNIHYLMRHGRAAQNRFDWFVAILQLIFPDEAHDLIAKLALQSAEAGQNGTIDANSLYHCALCRSDSDDARRELTQAIFKEVWDRDSFESFSEWFDTTEAIQHLPESDIYAFFHAMPTELRRKLAFKPKEAQWWHQIAKFLSEKRAWSLAEQSYRKAIEIDPKYFKSWNNIGNLLMRHLDRTDDAKAALIEAIRLAPDESFPWCSYGNLLKNHLGKRTEAEDAYRKAIELDPGAVFAWNNLGALLADEPNRKEEAETAYRKALELDNSQTPTWINLGNLLQIEFTRFEESKAAYDKACELSPSDPNLWNSLGKLYLNLNKPTKAEDAFRKAITLDSSNPLYLLNLAAHLIGTGKQSSEVVTLLFQSLNIEPEATLSRSELFISLCSKEPSIFAEVLEKLIAWSADHPKETKVFQFTAAGLIHFANSAGHSKVLEILNHAGEKACLFETIHDALIAHNNHDHLDRLAPERRVTVIEIMKRITVGKPKK